MREVGYDRAAAVAYARRWAMGRNPAYYDFSELGGDCTNFVSQCLFAGAGVMNYTPETGWFYRSLSSRAPAWTGVRCLYRFLTQNDSVGPYARVISQEEVQPGAVIQLCNAAGDCYHTLLVTATAPEILVAAHTNNALDRPLWSYGAAELRCLHIAGVRAW